MLYRLKMKEPLLDHLKHFEQIPFEKLVAGLKDDNAKKTFWINVYNAFNLYFMQTDASTHSGKWGRMKHFMQKKIRIAGMNLSLMNVENDILRRGQIWWALGYLRRPWQKRAIKVLQVNELDPRIHFALNCGAMSCPPIRFYEVAQIEEQLELATHGFMLVEVRYDANIAPRLIQVSGIFRLYPGDFGGKEGIIRTVRRYRPEIPDGEIKLEWTKYDNSLHLEAFID